MEYKKFRVRSPVKSFRDLDVYKDTTQLAVEIFGFKAPPVPAMVKEFEILLDFAKQVPRLIAESYGNKFDNFDLSQAKLNRTLELISDIIAKLDFLVASNKKEETKVELAKFTKRYQIQRRRVLNLKNAWERVFKARQPA